MKKTQVLAILIKKKYQDKLIFPAWIQFLTRNHCARNTDYPINQSEFESSDQEVILENIFQT